MSVSTQYAPGTPFPSEFLEMNFFESSFGENIKQPSENETSLINSSSSSASTSDTPRQTSSTAKSSPPSNSRTTPGSPLFTLSQSLDDDHMENLWGDFNLYDNKPYYGSNQAQQNIYSTPSSLPPVDSITPVQTTLNRENSPPYTALDHFDPKTLSNPPFESYGASSYSADSRTVHGQITPPNEDSDPVFTEDIFNNEKKPNIDAPTAPKGKSRPVSTKSSTSGSTTTRKSRKSTLKSKEQEELLEAKRRRFLERNRVAASKCRQKKKAWMQQLEETARGAQTHSKILHSTVGMLKNELLMLKGELLRHHDCDCDKIKAYLMREADKVAEGTVGNVISPIKPRQFSIAESEMSSASDMFGDGDFDMIMGDDDMDDLDDIKV